MEIYDSHIIKLRDSQHPERWQLYERLRELEIECSCSGCQPLFMRLEGASSAIQAWSVMRQMYCSNDCLRIWLERCWQLADDSVLPCYTSPFSN
jgi:hypothetical protein